MHSREGLQITVHTFKRDTLSTARSPSSKNNYTKRILQDIVRRLQCAWERSTRRTYLFLCFRDRGRRCLLKVSTPFCLHVSEGKFLELDCTSSANRTTSRSWTALKTYDKQKLWNNQVLTEYMKSDHIKRFTRQSIPTDLAECCELALTRREGACFSSANCIPQMANGRMYPIAR